METENKRNNGLELYRIVLTFMICVLHVLGRGGILENCNINNFNIYTFIKMCCFCAVDGYALLSGYVSSAKEIKVSKIIKMWFQVLFYSLFLSNVLSLIFISEQLNVIDFIKSSLPITCGRFWYFTAYLPMFFFAPYINRMLDNMNKKEMIELSIYILLIFSCFCIFGDYYSDDGYSFVWLFIMYILGGIIRRLNLVRIINLKILVLISIICLATTWLFFCLLNSQILISYISPTIIIYASALLLIFSSINFDRKIVTKISKCTFDIYLFQCSKFIWTNVIKNNCIFITSYHPIVGLILIFITSLLIFVAGYLSGVLRENIYNVLGLSKLCLYIEDLISPMFNYLDERLNDHGR